MPWPFKMTLHMLAALAPEIVQEANEYFRSTPRSPKTARSVRTLALAPFVMAALGEQRALQVKARINRGMGRATADDYVFDRSDRPGELRNPDTFGWRFYG